MLVACLCLRVWPSKPRGQSRLDEAMGNMEATWVDVCVPKYATRSHIFYGSHPQLGVVRWWDFSCWLYLSLQGKAGSVWDGTFGRIDSSILMVHSWLFTWTGGCGIGRGTTAPSGSLHISSSSVCTWSGQYHVYPENGQTFT